ncbi:MAG: DUF1992 domain-containing protein [Desulfovibrio sp.]|nr:DUF1992 domain-containing protein [Desulfovibrio sp.]
MQEFPFSAIQYIAERRIEEAMQKGEFDNLPGQGRPLELEDLSNVPEELRMAYKILRNAGCLSPELEERKQISRVLDLLEQCEDEHERLSGMQKLRFLVDRSKMRFQRSIRLEEDDPYYEQILKRLSRLEKKNHKA